MVHLALPWIWAWMPRPEVVAAVHVVIAFTTSSHAVMTKEDPRSAVGWVGLIWLSPIMGSVLYYLLGINRIRRKAVVLRGRPDVQTEDASALRLLAAAGSCDESLEALARLGDRVSGQPLTSGNTVTPLVNGDEAYPAMLAQIAEARTSVMLSSYIFDRDRAGLEFVEALAAAVRRGVEVRVLIDATGARYSFPEIVRPLRRAGVRTARFMPNFSPKRMSAFNLRSHRKILVVDGRVGFTGGMNIRESNYLLRPYKGKVQDLHFRVEGPVVDHLRQAFIQDWGFTTKEVLAGDRWTPPLTPQGAVVARGVPDGPDSDFEKVLWTMLGGIASARRRIRIVTPYFLPDATSMRLLSIAAMSGVTVEILLPEVSNIRLFQWAMTGTLSPLVRKGVRVFLSEPPFDHSKLMLVDDCWALIGSANWDARSLRLNFEYDIECFDREAASRLHGIFEAKLVRARPLTLAELDGRSAFVKWRDGVVRLMAPYL